LAACLAAGLSAQSKIGVSLDTMPLLKGIIWSDGDADNALFALSPAFEYLIAPHYSVGGTVDLWFGEASDFNIFYFGLAAQGRWYPLSTGLDKLFIGANLGFNVFSFDGEVEAKDGGFAGLTAGLKAGYKLMFKQFSVEPSMGYVYSKESSWNVPTPRGWQAGLNLGMAF
jgi:hypothetical protein